MIKLKNIVDESKYSELHELYHFTSLENLFSILVDRELKIPSPADSSNVDIDNDNEFDEEGVTYFSFCRNTNWIRRERGRINGIPIDCFIAVNASKLSSKYKIEPFNFWRKFNKTTRDFEFEERLIIKTKYGKIPNFDTYIKYIGIKKHRMEWITIDNFINMMLKTFYFHKIYTNEIIKFINSDAKQVNRDMAVQYINHLLSNGKTRSDIVADLIEKRFEHKVKQY